MRIVVNDIAATPNTGGAFSILSQLVEEARNTNSQVEWIFLTGDNFFKPSKNVKIIPYPEIKKSWFKRLWFDFHSGRDVVNRLKPDLYVSMQNTATLGVSAKQIVYLHQSLPYQHIKKYSFLKKGEVKFAVYQRIIGRIINYLIRKASATVVVQTEWMLTALIEQHVVNKNKVVVIPPTIHLQQIIFNDKNMGSRTFFFPAGSAPYKNHQVIYQAVDFLQKKGYKDYSVLLTINKPQNIIAEQYPEIRFCGPISREQVLKEYSQSVLLFPSYIETFGLPLLEARLSNSVIVAADTAFAREVLHQYANAYFFKYSDYERLADLMAQVLDGSLKRINVKTQKEYSDTPKLVAYLLNEVMN